MTFGVVSTGGMELIIIYEISPDPSLLKRGIQLGPDIFRNLGIR
jgi:hypothetical protein